MTTNPVDGLPYPKIREVVARLEARHGPPSRNGVWCFNSLYLEVTRRVRDRLGTGFFHDDTFMEDLDVAFANRYFNALAAYADRTADPQGDHQVPEAWEVLLDRQDNRLIHPIQFAIAGVNAHVNFDLAFAVVAARDPDQDHGRYRHDFNQINAIFQELEPSLWEQFEPSIFGDDQAGLSTLEGAELAMAHFSLVRARDAAWFEALILERLGPDFQAEAEEYLSGVTARFSRLLLHPR